MTKEERRLYMKEYRITNPKYRQKELQRIRNWRSNNKGLVLIQRKAYRQRNKDNPNFRLLHSMRNRINRVVSKGYKSKNSIELLGCSIEDFKIHLTSLFKEGMTWNNYGFKGWHIDHIRPCASFDLTDPEQQKECFHYSNLQPLWWWENLEKSDKE